MISRNRLAEFLRSVLRSSEILPQNSAILRNALRKRNDELPRVSNGMQRHENLCKPFSLNYKSAALPAELCRRECRAHQCMLLIQTTCESHAHEFKRPGIPNSNLDKPTAISYSRKDIGKTLFPSHPSDEQNSSNYQFDVRSGRAHLPNE